MPGLSVLGMVVVLGAPEVRVRALELSSFAPAAGERVEVRLSGEGAAADAARGVDWFFIRIAQMQRNFDVLPRDAQGRVWITPERPGVGIIGLDRSGEERVEAAAIRRFIDERGRAVGELPAGEDGVLLQRIESFKVVLRAGAAGAEAGESESMSKSGQRVEIRPLMEPLSIIAGSDLALRAYVNGSGAAGARVIATHEPTGAVRDIRCDQSGIGHFTVHALGRWRLELHELRSEGERWVLYSGVLVFESGDAEERQ